MSAAAVKIVNNLRVNTPAKHLVSEALKAGAPKSVLSIPYAVRNELILRDKPNDSESEEPTRSHGAIIVPVGSTRHISILDPYLTSEEMDGLAYRIKILGKNERMNSILLTNNVEENSEDIILPASALGMGSRFDDNFDATSPEPGKVWYALGGYDARTLHDAGIEEKRATLKALTTLAVSVKGSVPSDHPDIMEDDDYYSKIPFVSIPHGLITDGGYALAMGSYVLATSDSRFRIENPLRGLSLDPIGLSYILPRLGWEFNQPSADYPVGSILALTGYEADASDMVETGLATHFMDSFGKLEDLERALAQLEPYGQQRILKEPSRSYGSDNKKVNVNNKYRNIAIANLLSAFSEYDATGQQLGDANYVYQRQMDQDPSLVLDSEIIEMCTDRESILLNIAATFQDVFEGEDSMEGILERMKELAAKQPSNEEEVEFVDTAKEIVKNIEAQSPLAVKAVHKLMEVGKKKSATLEECMQREEKVQLKLLNGEDFVNWAKSGLEAGEFCAWKHKSIADVSSDEVEELLG